MSDDATKISSYLGVATLQVIASPVSLAMLALLYVYRRSPGGGNSEKPVLWLWGFLESTRALTHQTLIFDNVTMQSGQNLAKLL